MWDFNEAYQLIIELGVATESGVDLVTTIKGNTVSVIDEIVYAGMGYETLEQYYEELYGKDEYDDYEDFDEEY